MSKCVYRSNLKTLSQLRGQGQIESTYLYVLGENRN